MRGPSCGRPRVLGINDWAWRKRHAYGTILVDLENRCVVDLLPDRQPNTLAQWLLAHPGIEIISRDRGKDYIDGIEKALPNIPQVADRFYLLGNLLETLEKMLERYPGEIKAVSKEMHLANSASAEMPLGPAQAREVIKSHRQLRFEEVEKLQSQAYLPHLEVAIFGNFG